MSLWGNKPCDYLNKVYLLQKNSFNYIYYSKFFQLYLYKLRLCLNKQYLNPDT